MCSPWTFSMSVPQIPQARIRTSISSGPIVGIGMSLSSTIPLPAIIAAFILHSTIQQSRELGSTELSSAQKPIDRVYRAVSQTEPQLSLVAAAALLKEKIPMSLSGETTRGKPEIAFLGWPILGCVSFVGAISGLSVKKLCSGYNGSYQHCRI